MTTDTRLIPHLRDQKVGPDQFKCIRCDGWHDIKTVTKEFHIADGATHRPKNTKVRNMEDFYYCHNTRRGFWGRSYAKACKERGK